MAFIKCTDLSVGYEGKAVAEGLNFEVNLCFYINLPQKFITTFYHTKGDKSRKSVYFFQKLLVDIPENFCAFYTIPTYSPNNFFKKMNSL